MGVRQALVVGVLAAAACAVAGEVFFEEKFNDSWTERWVASNWKKDTSEAGEFQLTAGKWYGDEEADKGIQTTPDARFYATTADMGKTLDTTGKTLVLQFSVKHEQKIDCGGGYIKLLPEGTDQAEFKGESPYAIMFGPDICGYSTKRVHVIFEYKGKQLLTKKTITCETDEFTHVYTLVVKPDLTYKVLIDNEVKAEGNLEDDWDFLEPKTIKDPEASKPDDWDEREYIPDEEDVKPEGYDDIPEEIPDETATKPDDWDDEEDGEWEAPMVPNPDFKGPWKQKEIKNPDYKGIWEAPDIENPKYEADPELYAYKDIRYVGFELWQVKAGSIFDNILVTDDEEYAKKFAEDTWGASKAGEKEMFDKIDAERQEEAEKAREEAMANEEEAEDEEEDEYDDEDDDEAEAEGEKSHDEL
mmetsp:Transcript_28234/g.96177  ORF Transcript_28234/g.96177 Transcript_28234/m.96177 type:complete len:416 (-) Transcript_28234:76-1323(-)|eukprot:CAMPEP_0183791382 /NCGR_PEP_ID=MMETSP0803_2-20130417/1807_1 /TAXON_ID=195967 /ORGANISM="Crustomastix stigmata, Strain CCMP3273" /LENGTH=415 /DNA_ID=CAMNT_0026035693 /DNA_START=28 /DNA_END=1275 /DNA_ORIENTATION=-